jgi:hypothetical protein
MAEFKQNEGPWEPGGEFSVVLTAVITQVRVAEFKT